MSTADSSLPLVSYIMPVYNRANVVGQAIAGVIEERRTNYPRIEIVVMDGGSTDGTKEIIQSFGDEIQVFHSAKDGGAADAFNKGVHLATGEIIRYVAGDDKILVGHTRRMVDYLIENPEIDLLGARSKSLRVDSSGHAIECMQHSALTGGWMTPEEVLTWDRSGVFAYIETWFFQRRIFEKLGYLNTCYRICPDVDFAFRAVKAGCKFFVLSDVIINKIDHADGSNLVANVPKTFSEFRRVVASHGTLPQKLQFFYNFPAPLHERIFFGAWLWVIKKIKYMIPITHKKFQRVFYK
jgi:glycosyltransferase involved in cell wall biosynthesis